MKFSQGLCGRTQEGELLVSDNHITCYSVALLNLEKRDAVMMHVWEGGYNGLSPAQKDMLADFTKPLGRKVAVIAEGARSSSSIGTRRELERMDIEVIDVVQMNTGNKRWNASFDPAARRYRIEDETGKLHYDGVLPDYEAPPAAEQGLTDQERRLCRLQPFAGRNGDLPRRALALLDNLLDRTPADRQGSSPVHSRLIYGFMNARAKKAGFDDYCDYLEADSANFVKAEPQEMILRKIGNPEASLRKRFKRAGRDFRQVHVTPAAVGELLKDYPQVLDKFTALLEADKQAKKDRKKTMTPKG